MIRHMVFFSGATEEHIDKIYNGLQVLREIPDVQTLEIKKDLKLDKLSDDAINVIVYAEFENEEQLEAYHTHPIYRKSVFLVRPLREMRFAADIMAD